MGHFHRKKPAAKKAAPPAETAQDRQAKADRTAFIEQMAAKAALQLQDQTASASASGMSTPVEGDVFAETGGIHPSRLARGDAGSFRGGGMSGGGRGGRAAAFNSRNNRQAHRAPDLRGPSAPLAQKRTFDEGQGDQAAPAQKKQRTLAEIKKLKGPAAMEKEQRKRERQAQEAAQAASAPITVVSKEGEETTAVKDKEVDKAARKAAKLARKAAKKETQADALDASTETQEAASSETETKEERKARKQAEKDAKKAAKLAAKVVQPSASDASDASQEDEPAATSGKTTPPRPKKGKGSLNTRGETKAEAQARRHAKKAERKASKQAFKQAQQVAEQAAARERQVSNPNSSTASASTSSWAGAASSLGDKSAKFLKLMGGAKGGSTADAGTLEAGPSTKSVKHARKAEAELEKQFKHGMQAKQSGSKRTGLGA